MDLDTVEGKSVYRFEYEYCPVNYITPQDRSLITVYLLWRQGHRIMAGGVGDQPAKYIDAMIFLDGLWAKYENEAMEAAKQGKG